MTVHPALSLLLTIGLLQFWIMPAIAWALLKGHRDTAANMWFAGTVCYAVTATLFVVQAMVPQTAAAIAGQVLVVLSLLFFVESMRQELGAGPIRRPWLMAATVSYLFVLVLVNHLGGLEVTRMTHLVIISVLDISLGALMLKVIRVRGSRALWFVMVAIGVVLCTNLLRIGAFLVFGLSTQLLTFSASGNAAFIVNYLSVVLYSFGYWGFVIEKNRSALLSEIAERRRAQVGESEAIDREQLTQRLLAQRDDLIEQLARMQRAAQAGALSASIAHELSQPLTSVRLGVEELLVLQRSGEHPDRCASLLARIASENQRASGIIRTLRDVFGGERTAWETRSVDEVVRSMSELLRRRLSDEQVTLELDLQAAVPAQVGVGELEHVVLNLLTNALDAMERDGTAGRKVAVSSRFAADAVVLRVEDNGPGVAETQRTRLFDLFSGTGEGLGLGLWLSRYIVERHGGALSHEPAAASRGAAFTVRLLRASSQAASG